jgi:hypothetical protein
MRNADNKARSGPIVMIYDGYKDSKCFIFDFLSNKLAHNVLSLVTMPFLAELKFEMGSINLQDIYVI